MALLSICILIVCGHYAGEAWAADDATPLKLIKALPIEGPENNQPSGLTLVGDTLFSVSDKHDDTIYRIELREDHAEFVPHFTFHVTAPDTNVKVLDFEGITHDGSGNFYIVSEAAFSILRCNINEEQPEWVTSSLRSNGEEVGLFQTRGANIEGITFVDRGLALVCAERQPRGLIEINLNTLPHAIRAFNYNKTRLEFPSERNPDFTGMWEDSALYVVVRNADAICRVEYGRPDLVEKDVWSYRHIVNNPDLRYSNMQHGKGEGLCMDEERIYLIIDNNGDHRASAPEDRRPLLLVMERPLNLNVD